MIKHPTTRAERLRLKYLKDNFEPKSKRLSAKYKRQEIEAKELEDELRKQVLGSQEEAEFAANSVWDIFG